MEERIAKLEQILHKLFCCNSSQFQGPPGLQGEPGLDGPQGPQGIPGPVGPAGLVWQGEWIPCNVYQQNDAVGYNGASYYVTCETSDEAPCYSYIIDGTGTLGYPDCEGNLQSVSVNGTVPKTICSQNVLPSTIAGMTVTPTTATECCMPPDVSPCFALLASVGAIGPMGPQGNTGTTGAKGIDGANSLRWVAGTTYMGYNTVPNTFNFSANSFATLTTVIISVKESHGVNVGAWLLNLASKVSATSFVQVQITDSLDNSVFGTYNVTSIMDSGLPATSSYLVVSMTPVSSNGSIVGNREYTISWNYSKQGIQGPQGPIGLTGLTGSQGIQGVTGPQGIPGAGAVPKTYGIVSVSDNPYTTLVYDFNDVVASVENNQGILLPTTTEIGKEIVVFSTSDNFPFLVYTDNTETLISIRTKNIDEVAASAIVSPGDTFRFVLLSLTDDNKGGFIPLWFCESINGIPYRYNNVNLIEAGFDIWTTEQDLTLVPRSASYLNAQYGDRRGITVYCPNINLLYTNVGGGYWSQSTATVVL